MGRKLFDEGDKVEVTIDGKNLKANVVEYDSQAKQVIVKFEGSKDINKTWIPTKNVLKLDKNNKPIKRDRSTSRGRIATPKSSPKKQEPSRISGRTRSKSRDRSKQKQSIDPPGASGDSKSKNLSGKILNGSLNLPQADFSSADEEAFEGGTPIKQTANGPEKVSNARGRGRPSTKANKSAPTRSQAKDTSSPQLKDPEFSADDEPEENSNSNNDFVNNLIEKNSQSKTTTPSNSSDAASKSASTSSAEKLPTASSNSSSCSLACLKSCFLNLGNCQVSACLSKSCCKIASGACCTGKAAFNLFFTIFNFLIASLKIIAINLPMVLTWYMSNVLILFLIDKKNVRLSQFSRENFALPDVGEYLKMNWQWTSLDADVWILNLTSLWSILKMPLFMATAFQTISYLKDSVFPGYKLIIGSSPRISTKTNLRKVWLTYMVSSLLIIYLANILDFFEDKFVSNFSSKFELPAVLSFLGYITEPISKFLPILKSLILTGNDHLYSALTAIFLSSKSFYFSLILLATIKSYHDYDFEFGRKWQSWFLNDEVSTSFTSRFNVSFGFEMFSQIAYLVLAVKNPSNKYLWLLVNANFIQGFLATRSVEMKSDGQTAEGLSVRRHYQGTLISGFWFYYYHIFKLFTIMSFWRFINKPKTMTSNPYQLGAFVVLLVSSHILKYFASRDFPSEKRFGIHGKIRNSERLSEIVHVASLLCLCNFKFGNAPIVISCLYLLFQILDLHIAEECALNRSQSKWKTYFNKVGYRFIPKVY